MYSISQRCLTRLHHLNFIMVSIDNFASKIQSIISTDYTEGKWFELYASFICSLSYTFIKYISTYTIISILVCSANFAALGYRISRDTEVRRIKTGQASIWTKSILIPTNYKFKKIIFNSFYLTNDHRTNYRNPKGVLSSFEFWIPLI